MIIYSASLLSKLGEIENAFQLHDRNETNSIDPSKFEFRFQDLDYSTEVTLSVKDTRTAAQELESASYKSRKHPS